MTPPTPLKTPAVGSAAAFVDGIAAAAVAASLNDVVVAEIDFVGLGWSLSEVARKRDDQGGFRLPGAI